MTVSEARQNEVRDSEPGAGVFFAGRAPEAGRKNLPRAAGMSAREEKNQPLVRAREGRLRGRVEILEIFCNQ